jgi:transposase
MVQAASPKPDTAAIKPVRRPLPEHLPRDVVTHTLACTCPGCGRPMQQIGEDISEVLDYRPATFRVIRHVRRKYACRSCERIAQAPAPSLPIHRGRPSAGLLAHVLVAKYCDHLPLYRQSEIYARSGVALERSTLADWVGQSANLLRPLIDALERHVMAGERLHADDTPVPVLAPGTGKTRTARLWTYVRDERPYAGSTAPAVRYHYSADRRGEHPRGHLARFRGVLQADGYRGFAGLYDGDRVCEAACWAHVRRKFYDIDVAQQSPLAREALERIGALYDIERQINGKPPDLRRQIRETEARPLIEALHRWFTATLQRVSGRSDIAGAPRAIGWNGAGGWVIVSHARHTNFSRTVWITFHRRGMLSRVSVTVSPSLHRAPPQQGHAVGPGMTTRSRGRCAGRGPRTGLRRVTTLPARSSLISVAIAASAASASSSSSCSSACSSNLRPRSEEAP